MAKKIKIKIKINKFYLPIPALPVGFIESLVKFSYKLVGKHIENEVGFKIEIEEINRIFAVLKNEDPFEIVNIDVDDGDDKVFVRIYTR